MAPHGSSRGALPRAALVLAATLLSARGLVSLPSVFSDGVVLQQREGSGSRAFVYGRAAPGETVAITLAMTGAPSQNYTTTADAADATDPGSWIVTLNPNDSSGNGTLTVAGSSDGYAAATVIRDVTFGDVILCSGQVRRRGHEATSCIAHVY